MFKIGGFPKKPAPDAPPEDPQNLEATSPEALSPDAAPVEDDMEMPTAQPTLPKALVVYMDSEMGPFECRNCCYFRADGTCQVVEGDIDPMGCCNLFCPPQHDSDESAEPEEAEALSPEEEEVVEGEGDMPEATDVELDEEE